MVTSICSHHPNLAVFLKGMLLYNEESQTIHKIKSMLLCVQISMIYGVPMIFTILSSEVFVYGNMVKH